MDINKKPCLKCGCTMKYVIPRFIIMNGEVYVPSDGDPRFYSWECPGCGYIKLSGSFERSWGRMAGPGIGAPAIYQYKIDSIFD